MNSEPGARLLAALCLPVFVLLAAANSAGYRYGASDLAFYGPAVMRQLDPALFPRDRPLLDAQARLTLMDESVGTLARLAGGDLPALFLGLYLATLALLAGAGAAIGARLYRSRWTVLALLAALTLRHAVARSGTNTLEAYFHPRQLAFALGLLAVAAFLRGRPSLPWLPIAFAALLHPTTTLWFAIWLAVATYVAEPRWRPALAAAAALAGLTAVWLLVAGPLAGRLAAMDEGWFAAMAGKDYLFPLRWPASAWLLNLGYVPVILVVLWRRSAAGLVTVRERAIVAGCLALVPVFLAALAFNAARVALAIQLQPARIFWMLDFVAVAYLVWAIAEGRTGSARRAAVAAAAVVLLSAARGMYVMRVEFPGRPLFEVAVPGDWGRVMAWARSTPADRAWLADPDHASLYGTSVRMAAARDVFVEAAKDMAIGMYDPAIARRTGERLQRLPDFDRLRPDAARALAAEYDLTYLVTEQEMALPLAFSSGRLRVYELR